MKGKSALLISLLFLLPTVIAVIMMVGFRQSYLSAGAFVLLLILSLGGCLLQWHLIVEKPAHDFLAALSRAINGDLRSRFSCSDKNPVFSVLSARFNEFMYQVENQTVELEENRRLQNQLYENEKIYRSALELTCERVFEADLTHNRLIFGRDQYRAAFPFLKTEMFDDMIRSIAKEAVEEEDTDVFYSTFSRQSLMESFRKNGATEINLEYRLKCADGSPYWVSATVILLNNSRNESLKVIGYVKNIDAKKRKELEILKLSQKDGLTGLYNKKVTQSLIETYLKEEGQCGSHAVIMMDIDNFKRVNDTLGHDQGDAALVSVAQQMQSAFRSSDIVGRIGGDEFLLLMKNYNSENQLLEKLQQIRGLYHKVRLKDESFRISGSIGVSLYPEDGTSFSELFKKADIALYYSKAHGKNRFYLYGGQFEPDSSPTVSATAT